jgi:uncharacterized protein involved in copper resistance
MSDDLVKRLRWWKGEIGEILEAADRIEQLEQALREIANPDTWEGMDWVGDGSPRWIARAALENKNEQST